MEKQGTAKNTATPQVKAPNLQLALGLEHDLYLKREDLHSFGSHKGRSIPKMIEIYGNNGCKRFCVSSSGNAALAAARYINYLNRFIFKIKSDLIIFVGKKIDTEKMDAIKKEADNDHITIHQVANPKREALKMENENTAINLRQSSDDTALVGYEELAEELLDIRDLSAVFVPTSSGTTAQALHNGFRKYNKNPQIHIVQTSFCHPLVSALPSNFRDVKILNNKEASLAGAIVDLVGFRREPVSKAVRASHGFGWVATNDEIAQAIKLVKKTEKIDISPNSALSIVGLMKAKNKEMAFDGPIVCLITGK